MPFGQLAVTHPRKLYEAACGVDRVGPEKVFGASLVFDEVALNLEKPEGPRILTTLKMPGARAEWKHQYGKATSLLRIVPTLEVSLAPDYQGIVTEAVKQKGEAWIKESFPVKAGWWIAKEAVVHGIEKGVEMGVEKLAGVAVGESALPASLTFNAAEIVGDLRVENANLEDEIADFDIKKAGDVKTKIEAAAIGFGVAYEAGWEAKARRAPPIYIRGVRKDERS